jgi:hypothetical protein
MLVKILTIVTVATHALPSSGNTTSNTNSPICCCISQGIQTKFGRFPCYKHFRKQNVTTVIPASCFNNQYSNQLFLVYLYDNEYSSIINIYCYETFSTQTSSACTLKHFLDTLSDILDKCLRFSLIKIESVSKTQAKPCLVLSSHLLCILSD